ncbi:MAG TPA: hypothetical protein VJZ71_20450 [Phycisphaerae bacterium]|nr:hypothetical protein [Phycisphaerae bacterium]
MLLLVAAPGCNAPRDVGSIEAMKGSFLSDLEIARVADLMARDMVREPMFFDAEAPPRIALVKVENDTTQYFFAPAKDAYLTRLRTQLARALRDRVKFVDTDVAQELRAKLARWHPDDESTQTIARGHRDRHGVDYFLVARFMSNDKIVEIPDKKGQKNARRVVLLDMNFCLVDAETAEIQWTNSIASAAAYSTRDFQN